MTEENKAYIRNYNKLVRNYIPGIIKSTGKYPEIKVLSDIELHRELPRKLNEEVSEVISAWYMENSEDLLNECADLLEVMLTMLAEHDITLEELMIERDFKNEESGDFEDRIFLKRVCDH
jgi:phosphoribosyl-ATP pyrophosphohydrolase